MSSQDLLKKLGGNSSFSQRKAFQSFNDGVDAQEAASTKISCSTIFCCCCSKENYSQVRAATWRTLSLNASKFGNRARCCSPSQIFEYYTTALIFSQVAYAGVWVSYKDEPWIHNPAIVVYNVICTVLFTIEYLLRLWASVEDDRIYRLECQCCKRTCGRRIRWAFKPMSIFDLFCLVIFFATCTYYALGEIPESWVMILRFLLLLRLERHFKAIDRIKIVLGNKAEELMSAIFFTMVCVLLPSVLMYYIENVWFAELKSNPQLETLWSCVWWAICTITSVGYGDAVPLTWEGKVLAAITSLLGVATFAIPTGIIGATFVEVMAAEAEQRRQRLELQRLSYLRKKNLSLVDNQYQPPASHLADAGKVNEVSSEAWTPRGAQVGHSRRGSLESAESTMLGPRLYDRSEASMSFSTDGHKSFSKSFSGPAGAVPQVCCPYCRRHFALQLTGVALPPPTPNNVTSTISEGHESRSEPGSASVASADQSERGWV